MSDNWRDKGPADEDDDGDWRKTGNRERWSEFRLVAMGCL